MTRKTAPQLRQQAINLLLQQGLSCRKVAEQLRISHTTVNKIRKEAGLPVPPPSPGINKKLSEHAERNLVRLIKADKAQTATQAAQIFNATSPVKISPQTVRRTLKKAGFKAKVRIKKPLLKSNHKRARLEWCRERQQWTVDDWKRVVWSDEVKINLIESNGRRYCWTEGTGLSSKQIHPTLKYGGGSIMLWGCMTWSGAGGMAQVHGQMDSAQYIDILGKELLPTLQLLSFLPSLHHGGTVFFQQDNDPKHTSRAAKDWFSQQGITVLPWPSQSPDLNPIEHLWAIIKKRLGSYPTLPSGVHELWDRVEAKWKKITPADCQALIESMPRRVQAVIRAKGAQTRY